LVDASAVQGGGEGVAAGLAELDVGGFGVADGVGSAAGGDALWVGHRGASAAPYITILNAD